MEQSERKTSLDITVFILSYNRPKFLREMLLSVLNQTVLPKEIVILDNGSTEDTRGVVEDLISINVRWVGTDFNHHSFWNFERAFSMSESKYFTVLHDDDRLLPEFLEMTVGLLERNDELIAITTNGFVIDELGDRNIYKLIPGDFPKLRIIHNSMEAAMQYMDSFISFPNVVYRNGYSQSVPRKTDFGKIWDSIFLIDLASQGHIAILNEQIFEYRRHGNQDSTYIPEDILQKMDDYIISRMESLEEKRLAQKNMRWRQSKRFIVRMINAFLTKRNPRLFFNEYSGLKNHYLRASLISYYLLIEYFNYVRRMVNSNMK